MTLFWAAIDPQQADAEPKDRISGCSRAFPGGLWERKSAFEFPVLSLETEEAACAQPTGVAGQSGASGYSATAAQEEVDTRVAAGDVRPRRQSRSLGLATRVGCGRVNSSRHRPVKACRTLAGGSDGGLDAPPRIAGRGCSVSAARHCKRRAGHRRICSSRTNGKSGLHDRCSRHRAGRLCATRSMPSSPRSAPARSGCRAPPGRESRWLRPPRAARSGPAAALARQAIATGWAQAIAAPGAPRGRRCPPPHQNRPSPAAPVAPVATVAAAAAAAAAAPLAATAPSSTSPRVSPGAACALTRNSVPRTPSTPCGVPTRNPGCPAAVGRACTSIWPCRSTTPERTTPARGTRLDFSICRRLAARKRSTVPSTSRTVMLPSPVRNSLPSGTD